MSPQRKVTFEWDQDKEKINIEKHGISFTKAQFAFADPKRVILKDITHSTAQETRYFCVGRVEESIMTVRFTYREKRIRIIGAGYWRKGKRIYEEENQL
jgi:uncharacterized DUF497 family protein